MFVLTDIEASCNLLMGTSLAVSGTWNVATQDAFQQLRNRLGFRASDGWEIKNNLSHTRYFLAAIMQKALRNESV